LARPVVILRLPGPSPRPSAAIAERPAGEVPGSGRGASDLDGLFPQADHALLFSPLVVIEGVAQGGGLEVLELGQ
jgi:hypothetical protein